MIVGILEKITERKGKMNKSYICILILAISSCSSIDSRYQSTHNNSRPPDFKSVYYDLSETKIPSPYYDLVKKGILRAEETLKSDEFLKVIRNKEDWTYPQSGETVNGNEIVEIINTKKLPDSKPIRPKLYFYSSPKWGWDICRGFSFWPYTTKSTGCSNGSDRVYKNIRSLGDSYHTFSEFFIHEWLHAAGFGHGGNFNQCSKEKRNSVPIYIACVAELQLREKDIDQCSHAC